MGTIAVIGATGTIGGRVGARRAAEGSPVRAICWNPGPSGEGVERMAADLLDPMQALDALEGVDAVYLTTVMSGEDIFTTGRTVADNVIDAAVKHDVDHVVMHTALRADRGDTGARILDSKEPIEERLAGADVGYTILRPAWFLQNLWGAKDYLSQGVVSMPWAGDMVWGATDVEDVVSAAVALFERGPANRGFDIHIPGGITGEQIAAAATAVLGRDVAYLEAQMSSRDYVSTFPISEEHKDAYAELFDYFKSTTYLGDPRAIAETVVDYEPRCIEQFLAEELFAG